MLLRNEPTERKIKDKNMVSFRHPICDETLFTRDLVIESAPLLTMNVH